ncbi:hypothetical protein TNCV_3548591 [Trichonephila clavipes]|nr:hypothetical protein TNCV_3548591 [Trichonephila clavipes]
MLANPLEGYLPFLRSAEHQPLLTIAISDYRTSFENVELWPPVEHHASPEGNSRTIVAISFRDAPGRKSLQPDLSLHQLALRIACGTETTLIRKESTTTPLMRCPVFVLLSPL